MRIISHLLFGNHPKAGKLKQRAITIIKLIRENGGKIEAKTLEEKLGISRTKSPSMFYKPIAAMRRWNLIKVIKSVNYDESGKKYFRTEYELTPQNFLDHISKSLPEDAKKELELA